MELQARLGMCQESSPAAKNEGGASTIAPQSSPKRMAAGASTPSLAWEAEFAWERKQESPHSSFSKEIMPRLSLAKLERHLYSAADRLRQEGLDAATYKDYIFGMLFLKRCSDVFDAENEKLVGGKVQQGMALHEAEKQYGENPDYYDGFFVPERARWKNLQDKLNDSSVSYGGVLDTALGALSEANESLEHVL